MLLFMQWWDVLGVIAFVVSIPGTGLGAYVWWRNRHWHVEDIRARLDPHWEPVEDQKDTQVLTGGTLRVSNEGAYEVTNVFVLYPEKFYARPDMHWPVIAPGESYAVALTAAELSDLPDGAFVTLQVFDRRSRGWSWTPGARYAQEVNERRPGLRALAPSKPWWARSGLQRIYNRRQATLERRKEP